MNWKQLYTLATHHERLDITLSILARIEHYFHRAERRAYSLADEAQGWVQKRGRYHWVHASRLATS